MAGPERVNVLDLFSGTGGFSLGLEAAGMRTVAFCEADPDCRELLAHRWPGIPIYDDIRTLTGDQIERDVGPIDVICGGFPCQPFSSAGKRKGKADDRFLWPEMLRVIREVQPTWVVGENVAGILSMDGGVVFEEICASLENEGYAVQSFIIPAISQGAPHRRDRVWIVGYSEHNGRNADAKQRSSGKAEGAGGLREPERSDTAHGDVRESVANASGSGTWFCHRKQESSRQKRGACKSSQPTMVRSGNWQANAKGVESCNTNTSNTTREQAQPTKQRGFYTEFSFSNTGGWEQNWYEVATSLCRVDDGLPSWVDGHRTARLKALGNAIVPQVAYQIFEQLKQEQ